MPSPASQLSQTTKDRVYSPFVRPPAHWYRSDRYTTLGGFAETLIDAGAHTRLDLQRFGTQVALPTADAAFGGRPSLTLGGASYFRMVVEGGVGTPSDWSFLHNGSGMEVFNIVQNTSQSGVKVLCSNRSSGPGGSEAGMEAYLSGSNWGGAIYNGSQMVGSWLQGGMSTAPEVQSIGFEHGGYPDVVATRSPYAYEYAAHDVAMAAPTASANGPFTLFATAAGTNIFSGKWVETIVFDHVLSHYERVRVWEYIGKRYALANMPPYGAEDLRTRPIVRTEPFSWIVPRLVGGYVGAAAGRIGGWSDRVRPGHTMMAPNVAAQQVLDGASDAAFGGQIVVNFNGAPYYVSNLPAAAWSFLQGNYYTAVLIGAANSVAAGTRAFFGTCYSGAPGLQCFQSGSAAQSYIMNASQSIVPVGTFGTLTTAPTMLVLRGNPLPGASANYRHALKRVVGRSGMHTATPSVVAPQSPLTLGALAGGAVPGNFKLADMLVWDRDITEEELDQVSQYAQYHYAMAA